VKGRIRVGIVGIGFGQQAHIPAFCAGEDTEVVAIAASTPARAQAVGGRHGIPHVCDWEELVSAPYVDAVSVAVPPTLQPPVVHAAITSGKHVFCEKPLALTAAEARHLLNAAQRAGVVHAVDFEFRASPAWQRAKDILANGDIGRVRSATISWHVATMAYRKGLDSWKTRPAQGGGALNNFAVHSIDLLHWLFGPAVSVAAWLSPKESEQEWRANLWLELPDAVQATISVANDALFGSGHRAEICGERGTMVLENRSSDTLRGFQLTVGTSASNQLARLPCDELDGPDGRVPAVGVLVKKFVAAIRSGGRARPDFEDALQVARVVDAARRADRGGTWQAP